MTIVHLVLGPAAPPWPTMHDMGIGGGHAGRVGRVGRVYRVYRVGRVGKVGRVGRVGRVGIIGIIGMIGRIGMMGMIGRVGGKLKVVGRDNHELVDPNRQSELEGPERDTATAYGVDQLSEQQQTECNEGHVLDERPARPHRLWLEREAHVAHPHARDQVAKVDCGEDWQPPEAREEQHRREDGALDVRPRLGVEVVEEDMAVIWHGRGVGVEWACSDCVMGAARRVGGGVRGVESSERGVESGLWRVKSSECGVWCVVCGVWCVVCGV